MSATDWLDAIPGVNIVSNAIQGDWGDAGKNLLTGGLYGPGRAIYNKGKEIVNAPYDEKRAGYNALQDEIKQMQGERMNQRKFAFDKADSAFDDSRAAIKALFGDSSTWRL